MDAHPLWSKGEINVGHPAIARALRDHQGMSAA
jgi:hypothetical protein